MSQDQLGLFDTPPSRKQIRFSLIVIGLLAAVLLLTLSVRDIPLGEINAFIPMIDATTALIDLITATLLYVQASVYRSRALNVLASGYVFTALILIPHALTFPGAFAPNGLLGAGTSTTAWLYIFWRASIPAAVILYAYSNWIEGAARPGTDRPATSVALGISASVALAAALTLLATSGHDLLPSLYLSRSDANYGNIMSVGFVLIGLFVVATAMLLRTRRSVLNLWLLVVLAAWLVQTLILTTLRGRFTVNWYGGIVVVLLSHLFLMIALIAESSRLYARLALSNAARNRERESRLMSMDAVAAAIGHEVGQPLAAIGASASAGLSWLNRAKPDHEKAMEAMQATIDAKERAFDVIKSIRAMFAKERASATDFSLNDLVFETTSALNREFSAAKIFLDLELDEHLPPMRGNRVQIQRVLINLLTNAIESVGSARRRPRRIAIRSALLDGTDVKLEVLDNGDGIAPEKMAHIFEPFFTTKSTGTGLGLSLSRTIVEEHGGRLWASQGMEHGATFHLTLPAAA